MMNYITLLANIFSWRVCLTGSIVTDGCVCSWLWCQTGTAGRLSSGCWWWWNSTVTLGGSFWKTSMWDQLWIVHSAYRNWMCKCAACALLIDSVAHWKTKVLMIVPWPYTTSQTWEMGFGLVVSVTLLCFVYGPLGDALFFFSSRRLYCRAMGTHPPFIFLRPSLVSWPQHCYPFYS